MSPGSHPHMRPGSHPRLMVVLLGPALVVLLCSLGHSQNGNAQSNGSVDWALRVGIRQMPVE